ncbi:CinA family protein [Rickettsiales bacterium]|nr:CinA family protein [Rickettsiales bacterium]
MPLVNSTSLIKEAKLLVKELNSANLRICSIESCTGGLFSYIITSIPGSSIVYDFGIVSYSNNSKVKLANVDNKTIEQYGSVSSQTAREMSRNIIDLSLEPEKCFSVSCTGIAGPDGGTKDKPVGTVYISFSNKNFNKVIKKNYKIKDRKQIRLNTVYDMIKNSVNIIKKF